MEKQRRKRGVPQVKGTIRACDKCGAEIVRRSRSHRFCETCAPIAALELANRISTAKRRADGLEQMGGTRTCSHCLNAFTKRQPREIYCGECKALQKANKLPKMRAWTREYQKSVIRRRYHSDPIYREKELRRQFLVRQKRKKHPSFTINERMSANIRSSLKGKKNGASWESLVGYRLTDLLVHLERQFLPGMSWDNRSSWHIDHVIPLKLFKYETVDCPEFKAAWQLSNLRPLWAGDNQQKSANRTYLI